ncbi:MAG: PilZ domain-containing protein [Candidatus Competibacterales bacterium]
MKADWQDPMDRRQDRRWNLPIHIRVFDRSCNALLGHAVDIAAKGLQVISEDPVPKEHTFHLGLEIILPTGQWEIVPLKAMSVWTRRSSNGLHHTGLHIFEISPKALGQIHQLIDSLESFENQYRPRP